MSPAVDLGSDMFKTCPVSDLPRYSCAHCKQAEPTDPTEGVGIAGPLFAAEWDGVCAVCEKDFKAGSSIFRPSHLDNPQLPFTGWGCERCHKQIRMR